MALTSKSLLKGAQTILLYRYAFIPALLLTATLMACEAAEVDRPPRAGTEAPAAPDDRLTAQSPQGSSDEVGQSRRTAIVRAANRVSPSVVSVNVLRTRQVQPRSAWDRRYLPPSAQQLSAGFGSGVIVSRDGIVITNDHVITSNVFANYVRPGVTTSSHSREVRRC